MDGAGTALRQRGPLATPCYIGVIYTSYFGWEKRNHACPYSCVHVYIFFSSSFRQRTVTRMSQGTRLDALPTRDCEVQFGVRPKSGTDRTLVARKEERGGRRNEGNRKRWSTRKIEI